MHNQPFTARNIVVTDIETTGLDPVQHDIIEIGAVLISQPDLEVLDSLDIKITPMNIDNADPIALQVNGYSPIEWVSAYSLKEGIKTYLDFAEGAVFCSYNTVFDQPFIKQACQATNQRYTLDHHCIDIPTLVWNKFRNQDLRSIKLSQAANMLHIEPEPAIHRAINGALLAYEVLKKVV